MVFTATARWNFRGESWMSVEIEAPNLAAAGTQLYAILPITFFRGSHRLIAIRPQNSENSFEPKMLISA